MIEWGAKFVWYFHYMPVGNDAAPELLPTPEQREYMYHQIRDVPRHQAHFRHGLPERRRVCGRLHRRRTALPATSTPTATWSPASSSTIPIPTSGKRRLLEALQSPHFHGLPRRPALQRQPCCAPAPCWKTRTCCASIVKETGARSTDLQSPETVDHLCDKCEKLRRLLEAQGGRAVAAVSPGKGGVRRTTTIDFFHGVGKPAPCFCQSSSSSFSLFSHLTMLPFLQKRSKIPSQNRSSRAAPSKSAVTVFPSS